MRSVIESAGYAVMRDAGDISGEHESSFGVDEPATVAAMLQWIDRPSEQPFFLTYMPVAGHHPYDAPEQGPFPADEAIGAYRNAIYFADRALGQLIDGLVRRHLFEDTLFVVVGDHGQAFGQHPGNFGHTFFLYEENVHVPLLIAAPGRIRGAHRSPVIASHVDLTPTILDLLGCADPVDPAPGDGARPHGAHREGRSLLAPRQGMALLFTDYSLAFLGLRDGRFKFIHQVEGDVSRLFDLEADPGEAVDLASQHSQRVADYRRHLLAWSAVQRGTVARWGSSK